MNSFSTVSMTIQNPNWDLSTSRIHPEKKHFDIVNPFVSDLDAITSSTAFKRLNGKTQVFALSNNSHTTSRKEHSLEVSSTSTAICSYLGLNPILAQAGSYAHDLGHTPFGHKGEEIINELVKKNISCDDFFKHAHHGLYLVDNLELVTSYSGIRTNLNLTYATRDCIIGHSGRFPKDGLKPRVEPIDLIDFNNHSPFTWEGCVVKIADDISYLGTDLHDAVRLGYDISYAYDLCKTIDLNIDNTRISEYLIHDLCENSSIEHGLNFSQKSSDFINKLKQANYKYIYKSERNMHCNGYFELVLTSLFSLLSSFYDGDSTIKKITSLADVYPNLVKSFLGYLPKYFDIPSRTDYIFKNSALFDIDKREDFYKCIICFIAGLTDLKALEFYNETIGNKL
ncbi:MAG: HD domain-containing protein [Eubacteriales bacterium]